MVWDEPWKRALVERMHRVEHLPLECRGEQALYRRVLEQAVEDYVELRDADPATFPKVAREGRNLFEKVAEFRAARRWIFYQEEPRSLEARVMSFPHVCLILGVSPPEMRKFAQNVTQEELDTIRQARAVDKTGGTE